MNRVVHYLFEKTGKATETRRLVTNVMRGKDQPALRSSSAVNGLLDGVKIVAALLDEKCLQIIQVHNPGIESLSAAACTFVVSGALRVV